MFEKIIKRCYYRQKHLVAPLLNERIKYIQYWADKGRVLDTLHGIAIYLLRIVEFLHLKSRRIVRLEEIDKAAKAWAIYQYNHPQKRGKFSKSAKERFTWYAIDWLKKLEWLEPLPFSNWIKRRVLLLKRFKKLQKNGQLVQAAISI